MFEGQSVLNMEQSSKYDSTFRTDEQPKHEHEFDKDR